jgi:hypothetical protein
MLPYMASSMSASPGSGFSARSAGSRHNLAGLAIAALHDLEIQPCSLNLLAGWRIADRFDRGDRCVADAIDGRNAGAGRNAVKMNRACTAKSHAAAELRAGHAEDVAEDPQQRCVFIDVDDVVCAVNFEGKGHRSFLRIVVALRCCRPW